MRVKREPRRGARLLSLGAALLFFCLALAVTQAGDGLPPPEALPGLLLEGLLSPRPAESSLTAALLGQGAEIPAEETSPAEDAPLPEEPLPAEGAERPEEKRSLPDQGPVLPALSTAGLLEAPLGEEVAGPEEGPLLSPEYYEVSPGDLQLYNNTSIPQIALGDYLGRSRPSLSEEGPQILIMHTHGTEAYTMADGDDYTPSDPARTTDPNYNMIRIGEEMKAVFEEMGLSVLHDTSLYDYPSYTGSYARSLKGIEKVLEEYPTISVVLDVHRDALVDQNGTELPVTTTLDGQPTAQVMIVAGTEDSGLSHPGWEENLAFAAELQRQMMALSPQFPRPVNLRSQRFNQHMTPGSLLVEVGTNGNTLQEAIRGARAFARAAGTVLLEGAPEP